MRVMAQYKRLVEGLPSESGASGKIPEGFLSAHAGLLAAHDDLSAGTFLITGYICHAQTPNF